MKSFSLFKALTQFLKPISQVPLSMSLSGTQDRRRIRGAYRIAAIDDEEFPHKLRLRELGFNIDHFSSLSQIGSDTHYAMYVCDIMGVETDTIEDGVWTMREIKLRAPVSPLLGYTFLSPADMKYQSARMICDTLLRKSSELDELVETLDKHIDEVNGPHTLWFRIRDYLVARKVDTRHIAVLESYFVRAILKNDPDRFASDAKAYFNSGGIDKLIADAMPLVAKSIGTRLATSMLGLPSN